MTDWRSTLILNFNEIFQVMATYVTLTNEDKYLSESLELIGLKFGAGIISLLFHFLRSHSFLDTFST